MRDPRDVILRKEFDSDGAFEFDLQLSITLNPTIDKIKNAMDENGRRMCLELLDYMANNNIHCTVGAKGNAKFDYKGVYIAKEQLFENFL